MKANVDELFRPARDMVFCSQLLQQPRKGDGVV